MKSVGIRELKRDASKILRKVREEGASYEVTYHGRTVARIVPVEAPKKKEDVSFEEFLAEWDALAEEIGENWPEGLSAVDAVGESRRRLE